MLFASQRILKPYIHSCTCWSGVTVTHIIESPEEYLSYCLLSGSTSLQLSPQHPLCKAPHTHNATMKHSSYLKEQIAGGKIEVERYCIRWLKSHISSTSGVHPPPPKSKGSQQTYLEQHSVWLLIIHCVSTELCLVRVSWLLKPFLSQNNTSSSLLVLVKILITAFYFRQPKGIHTGRTLKGNSNRLSILLHSI